MKYYEQGDVLLFPIESLPEGLKKQEDRVLQYGERTNHKHQFHDTCVVVYSAEDGTRYVNVPKDSPLTHEEHNPVMVPNGLYRMDLVREYDYDRNEVTRVVD